MKTTEIKEFRKEWSNPNRFETTRSKTKTMKKLSITECRKFLKDKKNMQFENLYRMINKYVEKYDNYESQYMIQTSNSYQQKVEEKKLKLLGRI